MKVCVCVRLLPLSSSLSLALSLSLSRSLSRSLSLCLSGEVAQLDELSLSFAQFPGMPLETM